MVFRRRPFRFDYITKMKENSPLNIHPFGDCIKTLIYEEKEKGATPKLEMTPYKGKGQGVNY
ncbi:MAG: hypothetical protein ACI8YQ_004200 [Polaribacter sp.]|jgi:hypothetical protein